MSSTWGERVTVVLHYVAETEEYEGGFEAVTMTGVPHRVVVTGSDRDSAEDALKHLCDGLRAFGFDGPLTVDDATSTGTMERYDFG